jgi:hypothetical protein
LPQNLYLQNCDNLWKSSDGGMTWTPAIHVNNRCPFCVFSSYWAERDNATAWHQFWNSGISRSAYDRYPLPISTLPSPLGYRRVHVSVAPHRFDIVTLALTDELSLDRPMGGGLRPYLDEQRLSVRLLSRLFISLDAGMNWREIKVPTGTQDPTWTGGKRVGELITAIAVTVKADVVVLIAALDADFLDGKLQGAFWYGEVSLSVFSPP